MNPKILTQQPSDDSVVKGLPSLKSLLHDETVNLEAVRKKFLQRTTMGEPNECWEWAGNKSHGYGKMDIKESPRSKRRWYLAHRIAYELFRGEIPKGLVIDHLCRNTLCVNPSHMETVTIKVNVLRGTSVSAKAKLRNHCLKGHEYTNNNLRIYRGKRVCIACQRERNRNRYHQTK